MNDQILFVIGSLKLGGAEKMCVQLANEFTGRNVKVSILVLSLDAAVLNSRLIPGITVHSLETSNVRYAFFQLKQYLVKNKVNNVLAFSFQLAVSLVLIRKIWRMDFFLVARSVNSLSSKIHFETRYWHRFVNQFLIKPLFFQTDLIIAQSTGMKRELVELRGDRKTPIKVIFNFLSDPANYELSNTDYGKPKDQDNYILFVGKLEKQKNVEFLIRTIKLIRNHRCDFKLHIVGDGPLRTNLEDYSLAMGLEKYVVFEGRHNNVSPFYSKATVLLLCSLYEGFPNVLLEALHFSIPVVSVDCPSGPEDIIINNVNGFLVPGYSEEQFARVISRALDKRWDSDAVKETLSKFNKVRIVDTYLETLKLKN